MMYGMTLIGKRYWMCTMGEENVTCKKHDNHYKKNGMFIISWEQFPMKKK